MLAIATSEAEYIAANSLACQEAELPRILAYFNLKQISAVIFCDNRSTIGKNPIFMIISFY
ncbi:hypothetical protein ERO13_A09G092950v2 [Gossypium hirsutum]|nr:hypothetical protein ERO13_A09G092950v2 [Gossypium hirsutum]KAG4183191.1 hypothetical protein ERO13_A09G092950v2 [Gossypium hirsutum]